MPGWATAAADVGSEEYEENSDYCNHRTEEVDAKTEVGGVGKWLHCYFIQRFKG